MPSTRRKAFSLIEVVAALTLIGTTITLLLSSHARSLEQLRATREQQTASNLAHELITSWRLDPAAERGATEGRFDSCPGWRWTRAVAPYSPTRRLALQEVTLTIYHGDEKGEERAVSAYTWLERSSER